MQEKNISISAMTTGRVFIKIILESFISSFIIILALFVLRNETFIKHWIVYSLVFIVIFVFTLFALCITYLFRAKFRMIEKKEDGFYFHTRWFKMTLRIDFSDIDRVIRTRMQRNAFTQICLKNHDKITLWNNGFRKDAWNQWITVLADNGYIRLEEPV